MNKIKSITFHKLLLFAFIAIITFVVILFFLNINLGFKVDGFIGDKNNIDLYRSSVRIKFKTPIDFGQNTEDLNEVPNLKNFIKVEPETEFGINITGSILTLNFKDTLESDSKYKVILDKNLTDIYGNALETQKTLEFKTRKNSFSYIERNYPTSNDKLVTTDIDLENTKIIFENKDDIIIDQFAKNHDYYAISIENLNQTNNIKLINRSSKNIIDLKLENIKVKNLHLLKTENTLIYTAFPVSIQEGFLKPEAFSKIYIYNIASKEVNIIDLEEKSIEPSEVTIAPDDKTILLQNDFNSTYNIITIDNPTELVALSAALQSGGFNKDGDKIVFTNFDPTDTDSSYPYIAVYSSDRKETVIENTTDYTMDPRFFSKSNYIIFSERDKEVEGTKGYFGIRQYNPENKEHKEIVSIENKSLELPKMSPDDRYILIESFTLDQLKDFTKQRSFEFQSKPFFGSLIIFDLKENRIIKENIKGVNAEWEF